MGSSIEPGPLSKKLRLASRYSCSFVSIRGGTKCPGLRPSLEYRVALCPVWIRPRIIQIVIKTTAFGTPHGAGDNQLGNGGDIAQLEQIAGHDKIPIILLNFLLQVGDAFLGALETLIGADNADIIPHDAPDLIPIMRDYNHFIRVMGIAGMPVRDFGINRRGRPGGETRRGA